MTRVLLADDDASVRKVLAASLRREGYDVTAAQDGQEALELLRATVGDEEAEPFDVLISDVRMPRLDGMSLLEQVARDFADLPVVMLTAHGTVDLAVTALKQGAFDFVSKPYDRDEFMRTIKKAARQHEKDDDEPKRGDKSARLLLGESEAMQKVVAMIDKVADSPSTVLVTGESGTGKELVAVALHEGSARKDKPFIRINCGAIPATLIEAELFGYEKGAFTGAATQKPGRFELADEGTLFLDEIGDLPLDMQVRLLRVLQEGTFERVGGIKTMSVDVRLIAATNKDLEAEIEAGRFRDDLFYRLNVVPIALPPLRDRPGDIRTLTEHFVDKYNRRLGKNIEAVDDDALKVLTTYPWPGNIRELENIIERTVLFSDGDRITRESLPPELLAKIDRARAPTTKDDAGAPRPMKEIVKEATAELERDLIQAALKETGGNVTHAARYLKISRKSLQLKMRDLGLREDRPGQPD